MEPYSEALDGLSFEYFLDSKGPARLRYTGRLRLVQDRFRTQQIAAHCLGMSPLLPVRGYIAWQLVEDPLDFQKHETHVDSHSLVSGTYNKLAREAVFSTTEVDMGSWNYVLTLDATGNMATLNPECASQIHAFALPPIQRTPFVPDATVRLIVDAIRKAQSQK